VGAGTFLCVTGGFGSKVRTCWSALGITICPPGLCAGILSTPALLSGIDLAGGVDSVTGVIFVVEQAPTINDAAVAIKTYFFIVNSIIGKDISLLINEVSRLRLKNGFIRGCNRKICGNTCQRC